MPMPSFSQLLITGGSGFLGWNLAKSAAKDYDVFFTYHKHPITINGCQDSFKLDLQNPENIEEVIEDVQPEVIIHTAALTNADYCEKRRPVAHAINTKGTEHLATCAEAIGARMVYISSDLIFDGIQGNYRETDKPRPTNYYGETKLLGEKAVRNAASEYLILRMALMYGNGNKKHGCFTDWIRQALIHQQQVTLFTDQYRTPIFVGDAVRAILELIEETADKGIFHLGGGERLHRYAFGEKFCNVFQYDPQYLQAVEMNTINTIAKRGNDCSLDVSKTQDLLSFDLSDVDTGLQKMKRQQK